MNDQPQTENSASNLQIELTSQIVSAYVSHNAVSSNELPVLMENVHSKLAELSGDAAATAQQKAQKPAVPVKKSVHDDYIICLEDGKKFKSLKRHLNSYYGLSPEEYREKWGLPYDYPMVAPSYAKKRSQLARDLGLGRKRGTKIKKRAR